MNTSRLRTFSSISKAISPSENRPRVAVPNRMFSARTIPRASGALAFPENTMNVASLIHSTPKTQGIKPEEIWLGRQDSNLGVPGSKPGALPLGYAPNQSCTADAGRLHQASCNCNGDRFMPRATNTVHVAPKASAALLASCSETNPANTQAPVPVNRAAP